MPRSFSDDLEMSPVAAVKLSTPEATCLSVCRICSLAAACCRMIVVISFALSAVTSDAFLMLAKRSESEFAPSTPEFIFSVPLSLARMRLSEDCWISPIRSFIS